MSAAAPSATDFDVVIVGGGLVGASLAAALQGSGLRAAVIEAATLGSSFQPSHNDRTVALAYGSRRILESVGVWADLERLGVTPIERIHVSHRGLFGITRLDADDLELPALGYVVENRALGSVLWRRLERADGIAWFCPATVEDIVVDETGALVSVKQADGTRVLKTRLVIGADGTHSAVRRLLEVPAERTDYAQVAVVATVATGLPHRNTAYERFTDTGPLAALPMRDDRCAIVWSAHADEAETMLGWDDDEFLRRLQERFGDRLGRFSQPGARARHPLALTRIPQQARARVVLIGNAAHTVHPVAGQGFNLGLRDVAALAEVLIANARERRDVGSLEALRGYLDWRRRDTQVTEFFTDSLVRIFSNRSTLLALTRGLGLVAVDLLLPAKRRLVRITSGLAGRLPRLA
ncbi:MAG TPA: 2-octaprenyl-6-methoxyphenyl hydroxylase, partial [Burkholderiales bacterium]|nr:2-octaprenyl-6-methoxyphenyl hydroxylase [Burkholderiales bacterium]